MVLKAQVEFIVIFAIIIIAVVGGMVALQSGIIQPPATGVEKQYETIKNSIVEVVRSGAVETLDTIYSQGGFLNPENTITYGFSEVPVWRDCEGLSTPDIEGEIEEGIENYLEEQLSGTMDFFGKEAKLSLNRIDVTSNLVKGRLDVKVNLPTEVEGYNIPQPYEVSIPTDLYDVFDFSVNFATEAHEEDLLETISVTYLMEQDQNRGGENWLPVAGIRTGCGNILMKTRSDLLPAMENLIGTHVSNAISWNNVPVSGDQFYFNTVGGKRYPNIEPTFVYPPGWDLERNFFMSPDPLVSIPTIIYPYVPACMSEYYVRYSFRYPIIVRVKDKVSGKIFDFAYMTTVIDNEAGCGSLSGNQTDYYDFCVEGADCPVNMTVSDIYGDPVGGATGIFGGCSIGKTDSEGRLTGMTPCIGAALNIYKDGYKTYADYMSGTSLDNLSVKMERVMSDVTVNVYGVPVGGTGGGMDGQYMVYDSYSVSGSPKRITEFDEAKTTLNLYPSVAMGPEDNVFMMSLMDEEMKAVDTVTIETMFPNYYYVMIMTQDIDGNLIGMVNSTLDLTENDQELYVYAAVMEGLEYSLNQTEIIKISNALSECGIDPMSTEEQTSTC